MSGMDPHDILEMFITEAIGVNPIEPRRRKDRYNPIGKGGPSNTMPTSPSVRTRPGMKSGSKEGWFNPPPPKDSDPVMQEPALGLDDIAKNQIERPLLNVNIEKLRAFRKNRANEMKNVILRSYVEHVVGK